MDRVANSQNSPHTAFLQVEMDGITSNNITVIGATNYPEHFEPAILNRFIQKIELPKLSAAALNRPIQQCILNGVQRYADTMYFDEALTLEMNEGATQLGASSEGLDLRFVDATILYLLGDLKREKHTEHSGITYLRLQDVCFSFYIMKIQEKLIPEPPGGMPTTIQYIRDNNLFVFPY